MNTVTASRFRVKFTPHLGFCDKPFEVKTESREDLLQMVTAVSMYQSFLGSHNHSQRPKAKAVFYVDEMLDTTGRMLEGMNSHPYLDQPSFDALANCQDAEKWGLRLSWFPQVPCKPFVFPVRDLAQAKVLSELLGDYDRYLLEDCQEMRVDHCNMFELEMRPSNFQALIDEGEIEAETQGWMSWYFEDEDTNEYYESFHEWLREKA